MEWVDSVSCRDSERPALLKCSLEGISFAYLEQLFAFVMELLPKMCVCLGSRHRNESTVAEYDSFSIIVQTIVRTFASSWFSHFCISRFEAESVMKIPSFSAKIDLELSKLARWKAKEASNLVPWRWQHFLFLNWCCHSNAIEWIFVALATIFWK